MTDQTESKKRSPGEIVDEAPAAKKVSNGSGGDSAASHEVQTHWVNPNTCTSKFLYQQFTMNHAPMESLEGVIQGFHPNFLMNVF